MLDHQAARRVRQGAYAAGALALALALAGPARGQDLPILAPPVVAPAAPGPGTATLGGDAAHREAWTATGLRAPLERAWTVAADPASAPVVAGGLVIVSTATAVSAYYAPTGKRVWTDPVSGPAELATDGARVFVATRSAIAALDAATGALRWAQAGGATGPTVAGGRVWVGGASVRALDAATGKVAVSANTDVFAARPAVSGNRVYVTSACDAYALNAQTGATIWHTGSCAGLGARTLLTGGAVLAPEHAIYNASGGAVAFAGPAPGTAGAGLLLRPRAGGLDAYDASTLAHRWTWAGTPALAPAVTDATVWQVADTGADGLVLAALAAANGGELWSGFLPRTGTLAPATATAISVGDGLLLIPTAGGRLTALRNAPAGALGVAATVPRNVVAAGTKVPVTGRLASGGHGLVGPRQVVLEGDVFPFDGAYAPLGTAVAGRHGFEITTRVTRNTRLRLSADGATHPPTAVYATPRLRVVYARTRAKLVVAATLRITAEPGLHRSGRVAVYRVRPHGATAQRLGTGHSDAGGVAHFSVRIPPTLSKTDRVLSCLRGASRQGYGAPNVLDVNCGERRIAIPPAAQTSARRSLSTGTGSVMPLKRLRPASEKA
jgi:outer membrane protein assembly factor BamB